MENNGIMGNTIKNEAEIENWRTDHGEFGEFAKISDIYENDGKIMEICVKY